MPNKLINYYSVNLFGFPSRSPSCSLLRRSTSLCWLRLIHGHSSTRSFGSAKFHRPKNDEWMRIRLRCTATAADECQCNIFRFAVVRRCVCVCAWERIRDCANYLLLSSKSFPLACEEHDLACRAMHRLLCEKSDNSDPVSSMFAIVVCRNAMAARTPNRSSNVCMWLYCSARG